MADPRDDAIARLQAELRRFARERDWERYHTPRNLSALIASEAGELLALFRWGEDALAERPEEVRHELADVFLGVLRFADVAGIDLETAAREKIRRNAEKYPAGDSSAEPRRAPPAGVQPTRSEEPRVLAIDWSGARTGERDKIWLAEAVGGRLVRLESGRTRDDVASHLITEAARDPRFVVGLDFAFSAPAWFLRERGLASAPELWTLAVEEGERWLAECQPPFWGRPGRPRPPLEAHFRATEEATRAAGAQPKSLFQIGGAGAVGTGSLRGMAVLTRLHHAGFSVWPFDPPGWPRVVEIYPRLLTGPVVKSSAEARTAYLGECFPELDDRMRQLSASSEDAFDAAVSTIAMSRSAGEFLQLERTDDATELLEGRIWAPQERR